MVSILYTVNKHKLIPLDSCSHILLYWILPYWRRTATQLVTLVLLLMLLLLVMICVNPAQLQQQTQQAWLEIQGVVHTYT